ncbi:DUF3137 domain-containing protein [Sphingobacteriales bacterium UPWRP_1]|nr:hypothetical protein BVG80_10365 [Sphingobacteriales bacterium TSM_CSM]PSJ78822.1 DUF3137 domain-containing protein [Sphingobacteriales bacterium UPWRP_1]
MELLRQLFGPSKKEIWRLLSERIGGEFIDGGWFGKDQVVVCHKEWTIILDTYVVHTNNAHIRYTRMRAPYINKDGFRFTIFRRNFFSDIATFFGMEDIETGTDEEFDYDFVIKGNDDYKLWKFFSNERIRTIIKQLEQVKITVHKATSDAIISPYPKNVDELEFKVRGVIKDIEQLQLLFDLFAEMLDHLCHIGAAYEDDPALKNYYS